MDHTMEVEESSGGVDRQGPVAEDDNSMSGLSDCLVELEEEDEEKREIPFRSYLDDMGNISDEDLRGGSKHTPFSTSAPTLTHPLLSPKSVDGCFTPHGHIRRAFGDKPDVKAPVTGVDHQPKGNYPEVPNSLMSPENKTPTRPSYLSSGRNSRTPNTLLRLQEKHRQNERVRHHTLIKSMKAVCSRVPGYDEKAKETKVVMLQRVVDYICHMEHHIQGLSQELGIKLDLSNTFLTTKIRKNSGDRNKQMCCGTNFYRRNSDPVLAAYIPESLELMDYKHSPQTPCMSVDPDEKLKLRRQKISSPTVGSSSDAHLPLVGETLCSQSSLSSEDSAKPAPSNIPFSEEMGMSPSNTWIPDTYNDVLNIHSKEEFLNPENSLGFDQPDDFGVSSSFVLDSPLAMQTDGLSVYADSMVSHPGEENLMAVNPDRVLQTKAGPLLHDKLTELIEKKKESYLERSPLLPITNMVKKEGKGKTMSYEEELTQALTPIVDKNLRSDIGRKDDDYFVSYVPYMWKFHDMAMTRRQKAAAARIELQAEKENEETVVSNKCEEKGKPVKVDLRKTSWMNGFMMFSRINRRTFIEANPGVHTSHISKMMGHKWRNMVEEDQKPYKEKAKKYMEYMQRSFEEDMSSEIKSEESGFVGQPQVVRFPIKSEPGEHQLTPTAQTKAHSEGKLTQKETSAMKRKPSLGKPGTFKAGQPHISLLKQSQLVQVKTEPVDIGTMKPSPLPLVRVKSEGETTPEPMPLPESGKDSVE